MVVVLGMRGGVECGAVLLDGDEGDPRVRGQNGPRETCVGLFPAVLRRMPCVRVRVRVRVGHAPAAHGVGGGEEDGGLLLPRLAVRIQLLPVAARRVACTAASAWHASTALLRAERCFVARVGRRAVVSPARSAAAPRPCAGSSAAASPRAAASDCRHGRD